MPLSSRSGTAEQTPREADSVGPLPGPAAAGPGATAGARPGDGSTGDGSPGEGPGKADPADGVLPGIVASGSAASGGGPMGGEPDNRAASSPLRNRIAVSQQTFPGRQLAESLVDCRECGVGAIGLSVPKIRSEGYARVAKRIDASPIEVSSLNWIAGFTGQNGHRLDDTMDEAVELIRLAHRLGAPTVTVITGPQGGHIRGHVTKLFVAKMRELAEFAEFFGVDLAVLPMTDQHRPAWTFLDTLPKALDVVAAVDHPRVGLCINTAFVWRQRGLPQLLSQAAPVTKLVKLSDCTGAPVGVNDQRLPGSGRVRTTAIAAALDAAGYRGYYELDVWSQGLWQSGEYGPILQSLATMTFGTRPDLGAGQRLAATV